MQKISDQIGRWTKFTMFQNPMIGLVNDLESRIKLFSSGKNESDKYFRQSQITNLRTLVGYATELHDRISPYRIDMLVNEILRKAKEMNDHKKDAEKKLIDEQEKLDQKGGAGKEKEGKDPLTLATFYNNQAYPTDELWVKLCAQMLRFVATVMKVINYQDQPNKFEFISNLEDRISQFSEFSLDDNDNTVDELEHIVEVVERLHKYFSNGCSQEYLETLLDICIDHVGENGQMWFDMVDPLIENTRKNNTEWTVLDNKKLKLEVALTKWMLEQQRTDKPSLINRLSDEYTMYSEIIDKGNVTDKERDSFKQFSDLLRAYFGEKRKHGLIDNLFEKLTKQLRTARALGLRVLGISLMILGAMMILSSIILLALAAPSLSGPLVAYATTVNAAGWPSLVGGIVTTLGGYVPYKLGEPYGVSKMMQQFYVIFHKEKAIEKLNEKKDQIVDKLTIGPNAYQRLP